MPLSDSFSPLISVPRQVLASSTKKCWDSRILKPEQERKIEPAQHKLKKSRNTDMHRYKRAKTKHPREPCSCGTSVYSLAPSKSSVSRQSTCGRLNKHQCSLWINTKQFWKCVWRKTPHTSPPLPFHLALKEDKNCGSGDRVELQQRKKVAEGQEGDGTGSCAVTTLKAKSLSQEEYRH